MLPHINQCSLMIYRTSSYSDSRLVLMDEVNGLGCPTRQLSVPTRSPRHFSLALQSICTRKLAHFHCIHSSFTSTFLTPCSRALGFTLVELESRNDVLTPTDTASLDNTTRAKLLRAGSSFALVRALICSGAVNLNSFSVFVSVSVIVLFGAPRQTFAGITFAAF